MTATKTYQMKTILKNQNTLLFNINNLKISFILLFLFAGVFMSFKSKNNSEYDIVVYGETASGVMAAIQGARMGKNVVLVSKNSHVGGMATSGLTATDMNRNTLVGGIAKEFYHNIYNYYLKPDAWKNQDRDSYMQSTLKRTYTGRNEALKIQWVYESHVGEKIMLDMLKNADVTILFNERLDLAKKPMMNNTQIRTIHMESGKEITGKVFIDATYEGDLMAKAGVSYTVGREANSKYNETLNGIRINEEGPNLPLLSKVDPYVIEGVPTSGLLPFIQPKIYGKNGEADNKVQTYNFRVTLTNDPNNRIPIEKPANYNPLLHEVLARRLQVEPGLTLQKIVSLTPMPNKKTDSNFMNLFGASYTYPEGDYTMRATLDQLHKEYALGMLWFLANDPRVPKHISDEIQEWGLPKDEFLDSGNFPYQIYVREARRMVGPFVMTEHNVKKENKEFAPESIGLGSYAMDCHYVARVVDNDGILRNEGTIFVPTTPYPISFKSITPFESECTNLLVPICLSASHVAFASLRMEPVYMILGQSAGTVAAMAIDGKSNVQDVSYKKLSKRLLKDGQILSVPDIK